MLIFLLILTLLLLFVLPLVALFVLSHKEDRILLPFIIGVGIYVVAIRIIKTYLLIFISRLPLDTASFWSNKWIYGSIMGLITAIFVEVIRYLVLYLMNTRNWWSNNISFNTAVGVGEGWIAATLSWSYFVVTTLLEVVQGQDINNYGLTCTYLIAMIIEKIIALFFYIAMTYITQFAVSRHKIKNYLPLCIIVHAIAEMGLYFIPYIFNLPLLAGELFYGIITALIFTCGYLLIKAAKRYALLDLKKRLDDEDDFM